MYDNNLLSYFCTSFAEKKKSKSSPCASSDGQFPISVLTFLSSSFFFRFVSWIMEHVKLEIEKKVNGDGGSTDCRIVMEWWR